VPGPRSCRGPDALPLGPTLLPPQLYPLPPPPLLQVLREELNCTLPVELVWHGPQEMDTATLAGLKKFFDPLEGYDVTTKPYPKHQRK
jgi:hypothetical protein